MMVATASRRLGEQQCPVFVQVHLPAVHTSAEQHDQRVLWQVVLGEDAGNDHRLPTEAKS
jgi:hypothetical protein